MEKEVEKSVLTTSILYDISKLELEGFLKSHRFKQSGETLNFEMQQCSYLKEITSQYDLGVSIANGGIYLGFLAEMVDFPVMYVQMKRKNGAVSWKPTSNFQGNLLPGRKVLILEDDIDTGKTIRRAIDEIKQFRPSEVDILLAGGNILAVFPPEGSKKVYQMGEAKAIGYEQESVLSRQLADRFDAKYQIFK